MGSQKMVPVRIVVAAPVAMLIAWIPGSPASPSLHAISVVGLRSSGQNAIWSMMGAATPCVTTRTFKLGVNVASTRASAAAAPGSADVVDDAESSLFTPNSDTDFEASSWSRVVPKSTEAAAMPTAAPINPSATTKTKSRRLIALPPSPRGPSRQRPDPIPSTTGRKIRRLLTRGSAATRPCDPSAPPRSASTEPSWNRRSRQRLWPATGRSFSRWRRSPRRATRGLPP